MRARALMQRGRAGLSAPSRGSKDQARAALAPLGSKHFPTRQVSACNLAAERWQRTPRCTRQGEARVTPAPQTSTAALHFSGAGEIFALGEQRARPFSPPQHTQRLSRCQRRTRGQRQPGLSRWHRPPCSPTGMRGLVLDRARGRRRASQPCSVLLQRTSGQPPVRVQGLHKARFINNQPWPHPALLMFKGLCRE